MNLDVRRIDDAVLAVLWLTLHDGNRAWKTLDWEAMNRLHALGLISDPVGNAKSIVFTPQGLERAQDTAQQLFAERG